MLTADLVRTTRRKDQLFVRPLKAKAREEALIVSAAYVEIFSTGQGHSRDEIDTALAAVDVSNHGQRVAAGLRKLLYDRADFLVPDGPDPVALREAVFRRATEARRAATMDLPFDRDVVLRETALTLDLTSEALDLALYSDLKSAHRLTGFKKITASDLVALYDISQYQAVLLRASEVVVRAKFKDPGTARGFFRRLKFLRLLYEIKRMKGSTYSIRLTGPHSLFQSGTKYGLQLAIVLGVLFECAPFELDAIVHWGKERDQLSFQLVSEEVVEGPKISTALPDEIQRFIDGFKKLKSPWSLRRASAVLHLPGSDVCIPDFVCTHQETKTKIYFEIMGYWSREAVWRRVDLVESGLKESVLFAVSERLRVSESILQEGERASIYVYKGAIRPKAVLERLDMMHS
jgi:uncharacterized protein